MYESDRRRAGDTRQKHVVGRWGEILLDRAVGEAGPRPSNTRFCDVRVKALYFNGEGAGEETEGFKEETEVLKGVLQASSGGDDVLKCLEWDLGQPRAVGRGNVVFLLKTRSGLLALTCQLRDWVLLASLHHGHVSSSSHRTPSNNSGKVFSELAKLWTILSPLYSWAFNLSYYLL